MSVILDALRKLDREKPSRRNELVNIAVEILKPDVSSSRRRLSLSIAIGVFTIIATAAVTYTVIAKFGFLSKSSSPVPANLSAPSQQAPPASQETGILLKPSSPAASSVPPPGPSSVVGAPSPPVPAIPPVPRQQAGPAPAFREPVRKARSKMNQAPLEVEDDTEDAELAIPPRGEKVGRTVMPGKADVPPTDAKKTAEPTLSGSATTPPSLRLSTIVWYEEPAKRFAVINGVISYEGSVIEGVKVVEIYPNRVRFLQNGRQFEISMFE
jgi:hypothetical protein